MAAVSKIVQDFVKEHDGRIVKITGRRVNATLGSRVAMLFLGIYTKAGRNNLPIRLSIDLKENGSVTVASLNLHSNEGWYLYAAGLNSAYQKAFEKVIAELGNKLTSS